MLLSVWQKQELLTQPVLFPYSWQQESRVSQPLKPSLHCEDLFFPQLLFNAPILQESTDGWRTVCQEVIYWDRASNKCFFLSSFIGNECQHTEKPQLQISGLLQCAALHGQSSASSHPRRAGTTVILSTAPVCKKYPAQSILGTTRPLHLPSALKH